MKIPLFSALVAFLIAGPAVGQAATPYIASNQTAISGQDLPEAFDVASMLPNPAPDEMQTIALDVACLVEKHPGVEAGEVEISWPLTIRFYHLTPEEWAAGPVLLKRPDGPKPFATLQVTGCGALI